MLRESAKISGGLATWLIRKSGRMRDAVVVLLVASCAASTAIGRHSERDERAEDRNTDRNTDQCGGTGDDEPNLSTVSFTTTTGAMAFGSIKTPANAWSS